ncbi:TDP-4-oxo-6-deoxy-D-glucose transaminase [Actinobacillus equuli]|nr:TDP-4-oxo-6-deoxy-D-glucose transaminase [Actinobacillus equuli]
MSDLQAAYLAAQLEAAEQINQRRLSIWQQYCEAFLPFAAEQRIQLPQVPAECQHNAHMFYLKFKDLTERSAFIEWMKQKDILAVFHYIPLHSSPAGQQFGTFYGEDQYTSAESDRLVRLPLFYNMSEAELRLVIEAVLEFLRQ